MAKKYTKNTWTDEELVDDPLYNILQSDDIPINEEVKIELSTEVVAAGSPVNAARMNNIEDGIDKLDDSLDLENLEEKETPVPGDKVLLADSEDDYAHKSVDVSALGGENAPETTAENDFQVGNGAGAWIKKTLAETKAILSVLENLVDDTSPQLGGDLDLQQFSLQFPAGEPTSDDSAVGIIELVIVDSNSTGAGCPLYIDSDGHYEECDADAIATMPCSALALEAGTGSKKALLFGKVRNDGWNWTPGAIIYVSTDVGTLTATAPTGEDDVIQPVGRAISDDAIMFNPNMIYITHKA